MDSKVSEEEGSRNTPSPSAGTTEPGKDKKEARERLPPCAQPKLNGGQPGQAGAPSQFHPPFSGMMPPYVSTVYWSTVLYLQVTCPRLD